MEQAAPKRSELSSRESQTETDQLPVKRNDVPGVAVIRGAVDRSTRMDIISLHPQTPPNVLPVTPRDMIPATSECPLHAFLLT